MKAREIWECKNIPNIREFDKLKKAGWISNHTYHTAVPLRVQIIKKVSENLWDINITHWVNYLGETSLSKTNRMCRWTAEHLSSLYKKVY